MDLLLLGLFALFAGFVDAVVGGGGLIQVPALFGVYPQAPHAMLLGTNKAGSIAGTSFAVFRYLRRVRLPWRTMIPAVGAALLFSYLGAQAVAWLPRDAVRPLILALLIAVAAYTFARHDFGQEHRPRLAPSAEPWVALAVGVTAGFYDGFFGPGAGAFLIFVFVRAFGWDILTASAAAKVVNVSTNFAALMYFGRTGNVLWLAALVMAACNVAGSWLGTEVAFSRGTGFVRRVFLLVLFALIVKFGWDTVAAWI